jgi:hypothetical protein
MIINLEGVEVEDTERDKMTSSLTTEPKGWSGLSTGPKIASC